ncbi:hypothetical protein [Faecalispora anaeroviscerum]|uniref:hypothetical protein n=1 Tax=Faecalispora anaeroviscerum TaxID=2991836 RepID=UPI0024B9C3EE|nr:hypothetical protein [Faecalispora anaeroviscerum]
MADKKTKEIKSLVEAILKKKGINYDEWLYQRHLECLAENSETVLAALAEKA